MRRINAQIRVSPAEKCLIDEIARRETREIRTHAVMRSVEYYARNVHTDLYEQYLKDRDTESKAERVEPRKKFKKEIEQIKEETKQDDPQS